MLLKPSPISITVLRPALSDAAAGRRLPRRNLIVAALYCLACGFGAYLSGYLWLMKTEQSSARESLASLSSAIDSLLSRHQALPGILSLDVRIANALDARHETQPANRYLAEAAERGGLLAAYLIDAHGIAIASSNWNRPDTFVGHDYRFRPYFQQALDGGNGSQYAVGATTGEPGYFLSSPVMLGGRVAGVMVVKVRLDLPAAKQPQGANGLAIADEFGVIFLSSNPAVLYRSLAPLSAGVRSVLDATRRYGGAPISALALSRRSLAGTIGGQPKLLAQDASSPHSIAVVQPIGHHAWKAVGFLSVTRMEAEALVAGLVGILAGALSIATVMLAWLRRRRAAEAMASRQQLERGAARLKAVTDNLPAMVCFLDDQLRYVFANPACAQLYSTTPERIVGMAVADLVPAEELAVIEPNLRRALKGEVVHFEREYGANRGYRCFEAVYRPEADPVSNRVEGIHVIIREVTESKLRLLELSKAAELDHLTQLLNRKGFDSGFARELEAAALQQTDLALILIDVDRFKPVNDQYGHATGDALLKAFGSRLLESVRDRDLVARIGGDEFAVIISGHFDLEVVERVAQSIVTRAAAPFEVENRTITVGASAGLAVASRGAGSARELFDSADARLYEAKRSGRGACKFNPR